VKDSPHRDAEAAPGAAPARPDRGGLRAAASRPSEELRVLLRNDLGELARVNELATELLQRRGAGEELVYATQLALEEILSNVIRHGCADGARHEIELTLRAGDAGVELEVADDGLAFDPTAAPEAELDLPLAERRVGGLGIHLLRAFAREIAYERVAGRNVLRLRI